MKILVTGATGAIGSALTAQLVFNCINNSC